MRADARGKVQGSMGRTRLFSEIEEEVCIGSNWVSKLNRRMSS